MSLMSSFQSMSWGQDSSFSAVFKAKNAAVSGKFRLESGAEVAAFGNFTEKKKCLEKWKSSHKTHYDNANWI